MSKKSNENQIKDRITVRHSPEVIAKIEEMFPDSKKRSDWHREVMLAAIDNRDISDRKLKEFDMDLFLDKLDKVVVDIRECRDDVKLVREIIGLIKEESFVVPKKLSKELDEMLKNMEKRTKKASEISESLDVNTSKRVGDLVDNQTKYFKEVERIRNGLNAKNVAFMMVNSSMLIVILATLLLKLF